MRLSAFYAATFLVTGIQLPFWPIWLASRGLTAREIRLSLVRLGPIGLMVFGGAAGILRWSLAGALTSLPFVPALQLLHAFTFGASHLGAMSAAGLVGAVALGWATDRRNRQPS